MKMKFVYALLLFMLVVVWAHPDFSKSDDDNDSRFVATVQKASRKGDISRNHSESDDDDGRSATTVQKARLMTGDISLDNNDENRMVTKNRGKRGIYSMIALKARKGKKSKEKGEEWEEDNDNHSGWLDYGNDNDDHSSWFTYDDDDDDDDDDDYDYDGFRWFGSGTSSYNATRNVFIVLALLALQCIM